MVERRNTVTQYHSNIGNSEKLLEGRGKSIIFIFIYYIYYSIYNI